MAQQLLRSKNIKVVSNGKAVFYNITPGRYFVQANSQAISLPGEGRNVAIEADKTLTITLKLSDVIAPRPTFSPFPN